MIDYISLVMLELVVIAAACYGLYSDRQYRALTRNDGASVKRGDVAMSYFYGAFGASTVTLVAIPLSVEAAEGVRIPLVLLNLAVPAYLCFFNSWFRNKFLGWVRWVAENVES
jgi:hypothetical protein